MDVSYLEKLLIPLELERKNGEMLISLAADYYMRTGLDILGFTN